MDFRMRMMLWIPALAYEGYLLSGGSKASLGQSATLSFLGASLGFLLACMLTIRQNRRAKLRPR
jgi:hypothetical protein